MSEAKDTMKLGVASMAGMGVMGAMTSVPGMPAQASQTAGVVGSGLTLLNVGQLAKSGMAVVDVMSPTEKKKTGNKQIDRILG